MVDRPCDERDVAVEHVGLSRPYHDDVYDDRVAAALLYWRCVAAEPCFSRQQRTSDFVRAGQPQAGSVCVRRDVLQRAV